MIYKQFNNIQVPALGLGTWRLSGSECIEIVKMALDIGYRHIDTADAYGNEADIGIAHTQTGISREEIFITTKLPWGQLKGEEVLKNFDSSLNKLRTDYVDLLLIHWPSTEGTPVDETLEAMKILQAEGKVRAIGVSNFTPNLLKEALQFAGICCNQVEYHPYLNQNTLLDIAVDHDLMLTAYCPLARGKVNSDKTILSLAQKHGKLPSQIALRWLIQQPSVLAIPKTATPEHLKSNIDIFDFELEEDDMEAVFNLNQNLRLIDPPFAPAWNN